MISFGHLQLQRIQLWGQRGFAFSALFLPAMLALAQQTSEAVPPSLPAEISKGSSALTSPDKKEAPAGNGPDLRAHPSPAAAANAQRAARQSDAPSVVERKDSGVSARDPITRPKRVTPPPRSSPAPSP